jgi:hypothetical protein
LATVALPFMVELERELCVRLLESELWLHPLPSPSQVTY